MIGQDLTIPTLALMRPGAAGLALDFVAGVYRLDGADYSSFAALPGASFSRTGAGTALTVAGGVTSFATGAPRITDRGLLVEEARTNLFLNSAAPVTQTITLSAGTWQQTAWGSTGAVTSTAGTAVGTGFGVTASSANGTSRSLVIATAGTVTFTVSGAPLYAQVELGGFATSPIITTGASATRGADTAFITGAAALATTPAVLVADFTSTILPSGVGSIGILGLDDGSLSNRVQLRAVVSGGQAQNTVVSGGSVLLNSDGAGGNPLSSLTKQALRVSQAGAVTTARNGTVMVGPSGAMTMPTLNRVSLAGLPSSSALNGHLARARIIPGEMSDAQLQTVTQ
ncbi:hypothetical protein [Brevundimonas goettingensis]|uniref:Uncharacterized protein n=1 Tax=Brevundimonas goettingensis TaxID=2774190 RepID=A0A975GVL9_9CAUL|nr:hypothetical protein [Brevundimonas goettingensis]QTC91586.1 hypothetical protein IFJ75_01210 [Brevundimonas goettingensis]